MGGEHFYDLTTEEGRSSLRVECKKLREVLYQEVQIGIRVNRLRRTLKRERLQLEETLSQAKSPLARIKLEQELKVEFDKLTKLREEILDLNQSKILARQEEALARAKLKLYDSLLIKQQTKGIRCCKPFKLSRLSPKVKHYRY